MKALLRYIFSFPLLLASLAALGQIPADPAEKVGDSLKVTIDTLKVESDTLMLPVDTLGISVDTTDVNIASDSLQISTDSLGVRQDTVIVPVDIPDPADSVNLTIDLVLIPQYTIKVPLDSNQIPEDSTLVVKEEPEVTIKEPRQKIKQPKDTIIGPSGIEVFVDYGKLITIPSEFETKAEGGISFNFREKLQILAEVGYGKISPQEAIKNGNYTSEGIYGRGGIAYGGEILPKSYAYIGVMFGSSQFEDSGTVLIESEAWDDYDGTFNRTDLEATWIEYVLITETEIKDNLFLGSKWRLRSLRKFDYDYDPIVYAIPGYGRSFDSSIPAINLYIKYRFKF